MIDAVFLFLLILTVVNCNSSLNESSIRPLWPAGFTATVVIQHSTKSTPVLARWTTSVELQFEKWLSHIDGHVIEHVYDFNENTEFAVSYEDNGADVAQLRAPKCSSRPIDVNVPQGPKYNGNSLAQVMARFVPQIARLRLVSDQFVNVNFRPCRHFSIDAKSTTIDYFETADAERHPRRLTLRSRFGAGYWASFTFVDVSLDRPRLSELRLPPAVRALCTVEKTDGAGGAGGGAGGVDDADRPIDDVQERIRLLEQADAADSVARRQRVEREQWLARIRARHQDADIN
jgi:hypothetical protein